MKNLYTLLALLITAILTSPAQITGALAGNNTQNTANIVVSIKPLHSLVANITKGISTPALILNTPASPHTYNLKPSDATTLAHARVIFWIGPQVEAFLQKPLTSLASSATIVSFVEPEDDHEEHKDEKHADEKHDDEKHSEHEHEGADPHIWLNPVDAKEMVEKIAATLAKADPANAAEYQTNLLATLERLDALDRELAAKLSDIAPILVFHNAYTHLAERYNIKIAGVVVHNPELTPGAGHIRKIRQQIKTTNAACLFAEPQFSSKIVDTIARNTKVKTGTLDPLASNLEAGPEHYFTMMRAIANSLTNCR